MAITTTYNMVTTATEAQASQTTINDQRTPDILGLSNGGYVVSNNTEFGAIGLIILDFYNSAGAHIVSTPAYSDTDINAIGEGRLTELANGNVLVVWEDADPTDNGLYARIFNSSGAAQGNEILLLANAVHKNLDVTALSNGNFVVAYEQGSNVSFRIYNSSGVVQTAGDIGDPLSGKIYDDAVVTELSGGGFAVAYADIVPSTGGIFTRTYNADGTARTINQTGINTGDFHDPAIAALNNGNYAIVFESKLWGGENGTSGITLIIRDSFGNGVTSSIHVNNDSINEDEIDPDITVLSNGFIVVTWSWALAGPDEDIYARVFDQNGNPVTINGSTTQFVITTSATRDFESAVTALAGGEFATVWQDSDTADGSGGRLTSEINALTRTINGDALDNTLTGDELPDIIIGLDGNDTIDGKGGQDLLYGGNGNDRITYDANDDLANVLGGADTDTLVVLGGFTPVSFDLAAHQFEIAEQSFGIGGGAAQRDTYNASWQRTDRTIWQADNSRSDTHFDPLNLINTVQVDDNFDTNGTYVSQFGYYDTGGRWAATFNLAGPFENIYNYFDAANQLDYTTGRFDTGEIFLEDTDQGNLHDWTTKYAVNTASNQADYQYDYYDDGTRSYLDHDQNGVEIYLYQYTFYNASNVPTSLSGIYNDGTPYDFIL